MKYFIYDTETEGVNLVLSRPWQFAGILCNENEILEKFDLHIDIANINVSEGAAKVTGFNLSEHNAKKQPISKTLDIFDRFINDDDVVIMGHNILGFDIYQIRNLYHEGERKIDWSYLTKCIDTHCLARGIAYEKKPPQKQPDFLAWNFRMLNDIRRGTKTNLGFLAKEYNVELDESKLHDALYDIEINFEVFKKMSYEMDFNPKFLIDG